MLLTICILSKYPSALSSWSMMPSFSPLPCSQRNSFFPSSSFSLFLSSNKKSLAGGFSLQFHTINFPYAIRVVRPRKINLTWRPGISSRLVKNGNYRHFKKLISQSVWNRVEKVGGIWPGTRSSAKSTGSNEFLLSSSSPFPSTDSNSSSSKNRGSRGSTNPSSVFATY